MRKRMTEWNPLSIAATKHQRIVAILSYTDEDGDTNYQMEILSFDGIRNRWRRIGEGMGDIMLKDILY